MRKVTHLVSLGHALQRSSQFLPHEIAVAFIDHAQQWAADEVAALKSESFQRRRVAPFEIAFSVDSVNRLARTLKDVRQQRLVLAGDSLHLTQLGKIARRAHHRDRVIVFIQHRLN